MSSRHIFAATRRPICRWPYTAGNVGFLTIFEALDHVGEENTPIISTATGKRITAADICAEEDAYRQFCEDMNSPVDE
jgi:hypothetical protein